MFNLFKKSKNLTENSEYRQYIRNEYKKEWRYFRQHLYNPLSREDIVMRDFIEIID